jgi:hypothetical protein
VLPRALAACGRETRVSIARPKGMRDAQAVRETHGSMLALSQACMGHNQEETAEMKRGTLIAAVVLAIGAFACERKHDDRAGETTTTSGTVHEQQSTGSGTYQYQGSPGVTGGGTTSAGNESTDVSGASGAAGASTGTDRNTQPSTGTGSTTSMGTGTDTSGSSLAADQSGSLGAKDAGIASDFEKKDGGHVAPSTGTSKAKSGDNKSTPLGDGTSGQYTGGKGTYGGKDTHGTGDKK